MDSIYSKSQCKKKITSGINASHVVYDDGGNYISVNNQAYLLNGIQIRPDKIMEANSVSTEQQYAEYIEPLFQKSAELGYQTVIFPIHWKQIEKTQNTFNYTLLNRYYGYAEKYNLNIQLLWFGSDVCGYNTNVPRYILDDTSTYARLSSDPDVLDYSDEDLIERECYAFQQLLTWLSKNDLDKRTIAIQLENEPNEKAYNGPSLDTTSEQTYNSTSWCSGQKAEILNLIDRLGMLVKNGPYKCVTRVNLVTHNYLWSDVDRLKTLVEEVMALDGVDMVGYDTYQSDASLRLLENSKNVEKNIAHWPEFGADGTNYVPAMLLALANRAGIFGYQLKASEGDTAGAIIAATDNTWTLPEGEKISDDKYRIDANELKAVNGVVNKAGSLITLNDVNSTAVFNVERETNSGYFFDYSENQSVAGISVTFTNSDAVGFGGCGYATKVSDNEMLVFATRGESSFSFKNKTVASAESGSYVNGVWNKDSDIAVNNSKITISSTMAYNYGEGTLIRVIFN